MSQGKTSIITRIIKRIKHNARSLFKQKSGGAKKADIGLAMEQVIKARETQTFPSLAQLVHLPKLLTATEKQIALVAILTIITTGSVLGFQYFNGGRVEVASIGGVYTEGFIGFPQLINPLYASTSDADNDLAHLIYSGLMRYDSNEGLVPDLAESYTVSEDGKTYTFNLRDDAKWHDGKPVQVDDIIFTFTAIQNPEYRSPLQISFSGISIKQTGEHTVVFELSEPFNPFLSLLTVGILPSHLWQDIAPLNVAVTELNKKPIGSGPFTFEKLEKDIKGIRSYTLSANRDFYRGSPKIDSFIVKFYTDATSATEALRNQNIEGISYLPPEVVTDFENDPKLNIFSPALHQYNAVFFNQKNSVVIEDDAVRKALAGSVDRIELINEALGGRGKVTNSFILDGMIGAYPDLVVPKLDLADANKTLEDAGWLLEEGSPIRKKGEQSLSIQISTLGSEEFVKTAEVLKTQWLKVGADISINIISNTDFQNNTLRNREYDILLSGELYGIDPDPYAFWHSSQTNYPGFNLSGFSNRKADEFIEQGRIDTDPEKRAEAYRALQDLVIEENSAIFLYQPTYSFALPKKLQNVSVSHIISPADRFSTITDWYIKTKKIFE